MNHLPLVVRIITFTLCLALLLVSLAGKMAAQDNRQPVVENVNWILDGDYITITYDMNAGSDEQYTISIIMLDEDNPDFHITPRAVTGNIGTVKGGGMEKKIVWDYRKDLDEGLQGAKYYFQINARKLDDRNPWKYIAIGAGVAAGGLATFLLLNRGSDATPGTTLPGPPDRP